MGFFDKAREFLGLGGSTEEEAEDEAPGAGPPPVPRAGSPALERLREERGRSKGGRDRKDRPPLREPPQAQGRSVEDALEAREAGDRAGARAILAEIDRGGGLRVVLRAAAALEAGDEKELAPLLAAVRAEAEGWRLALQLAAALGEAAAAEPYLARAAREKAPAWALGWTRAAFTDEAGRREGLVELLFADAALARMVAARELGVGEVAADAEVAGRYASFAHGRDCIKRFGAPAVAALVARAWGRAS